MNYTKIIKNPVYRLIGTHNFFFAINSLKGIYVIRAKTIKNAKLLIKRKNVRTHPFLKRKQKIKGLVEIDKYTDQEIVQAILERNTFITKEYLYRKCYPLFAAIHSKYYTDCETPVELINEIYVYILIPHKETHRSKLQNFGFRCTLTMWLKIVTENYCHQLFAKRLPVDTNNGVLGDRNIPDDDSLFTNTRKMDMEDVQRILNLMPNRRYSKLIEYRYVDGRSNEETAQLLDMSMANYYNKHKLAKAQYCEILRKEGLI